MKELASISSNFLLSLRGDTASPQVELILTVSEPVNVWKGDRDTGEIVQERQCYDYRFIAGVDSLTGLRDYCEEAIKVLMGYTKSEEGSESPQ